MKKVIVVSKTHLDLGFTDFAENIKKKYIDEFIPGAIKFANSVNKTKKRFVWTTGSWLISESLRLSEGDKRERLINALKCGDIAPHAMPFTTHTELLDYDTLDYGLSIVDEIDAIANRKTIAAKMTDVPGHSIALVPLLARHGVKLLHIGVNGASALPKVPPCFVWKNGESEVVVIYSGGYGGEFTCEYIDDVLYLDHTLDNRGASTAEKIEGVFNKLANKYVGYEVVAGRLDDYAEKLWSVKDKLPIITSEIGDTWIHGVGSDPFKTGAMRELIRLKNKWLQSGELVVGNEEYKNLNDKLLCIAEHTWAKNLSVFFADYTHYLRKDFDLARKNDVIKLGNPLSAFPYNIINSALKLTGNSKITTYSEYEKSWSEQREYVTCALKCLSDKHRQDAEKAIARLIPSKVFDSYNTPLQSLNAPFELNKEYCVGKWQFALNALGGIAYLKCDGKSLLCGGENAIFEYHSYSDDDYNFWLKNYSRNLQSTRIWATTDFSKPNLRKYKNKYPSGLFKSEFVSGSADIIENELSIIVNLKFADILSEKCGAPRKLQVKYLLNENGLKIAALWLDKPASRLPESLLLRLYPSINSNADLCYYKIGQAVDNTSVVEMGNRKLSAVEKIVCENGLQIVNAHAPLVELGKDNILHVDNVFAEAKSEGLSYVLFNNIWGTNFVMWYEDNALFEFDITNVKD